MNKIELCLKNSMFKSAGKDSFFFQKPQRILAAVSIGELDQRFFALLQRKWWQVGAILSEQFSAAAEFI